MGYTNTHTDVWAVWERTSRARSTIDYWHWHCHSPKKFMNVFVAREGAIAPNPSAAILSSENWFYSCWALDLSNSISSSAAFSIIDTEFAEHSRVQCSAAAHTTHKGREVTKNQKRKKYSNSSRRHPKFASQNTERGIVSSFTSDRYRPLWYVDSVDDLISYTYILLVAWR